MATGATAAAIANGVCHEYENGVVALDEVSVSLEPGSITAFVGRNGSGKTTLLRILAGLLPVQSGTVSILGESANPPATSLRARLAYVSQSAELDPEITVAETFALFTALYGLPKAEPMGRALAADFGLTEHIARLVGALSGGLRQRLHLALGFLHQPELLLLDEPTAALDPAGRDFVWDLLQRRRRDGQIVAVITHDLADVATHCQAVVLLDRGKVRAAGSPGELIAAHAGWVILCELAPGDVAKLVAGLRTLPGVSGVSGEQKRIRLALTADGTGEAQEISDRVLAFCNERGAEVVGLQLKAPDLSVAYFQLTGEELDSPDQPGSKPESQRRRRE